MSTQNSMPSSLKGYFYFLAGLITYLLVLTTIGTRETEVLLDLFAYALPLIAGYLAGGGLYYEPWKRQFFQVSIWFLSIGLICFCASKYKTYADLSIAATAIAIVVAVVWLGIALKRSTEKPTRIDWFWYLLTAFGMLSAAFLACIFAFK